jgi:hypothetical protein
MSAMNGAGTDIVGEAKGEKLNGPQREEKKKLGESIKPVFQAFITKTLEAIKQTLLSPGIYIALTRNLVNLCCKIFLSTVTAGFISGAQDLFKGLVNMADAASTRIKSYMLSRKVTIMSGHPATVVQSIKTAMNLGILQGLWETLKGAGNVALAVSTWGTAMIVGVVTAIFEMVVKLIWRLVEISKMNRIFEEARQLWRDREGAQALHKRPFAFHEWYYDRAIHCPPIAILTLNSGICGDKMVYLSMFNSQNQPITTEEFQNGVRYLDHMRVYGVGYLESCGYSFYGSDAISNSLLQHIKSHTSPQTVGDKIWGAVKTFANS